MVNVKQAATDIARLTMLKFFPADKEARNAIVKMVCEMAADNDQVRWLVDQILRVHNEWPGPAEVRKVFSAKYRPMDGIAVSVCSCGCGKAHEFRLAPRQQWPPRELDAGEVRLLEAAPPSPEEAEAERVQLQQLMAELPRMARAIPSPRRRFAERLREIVTAPNDRQPLPGPTPQVITQADVDAAVAELHRKKAEQTA